MLINKLSLEYRNLPNLVPRLVHTLSRGSKGPLVPQLYIPNHCISANDPYIATLTVKTYFNHSHPLTNIKWAEYLHFNRTTEWMQRESTSLFAIISLLTATPNTLMCKCASEVKTHFYFDGNVLTTTGKLCALTILLQTAFSSRSSNVTNQDLL